MSPLRIRSRTAGRVTTCVPSAPTLQNSDATSAHIALVVGTDDYGATVQPINSTDSGSSDDNATGMRLSPPIGAIRNPLTVVLLSIVTLGIYGLWWTYVMFRDTREFGHHGFGGIAGLLFAIVLPFLPPFLLPWQVGTCRVDTGLDRRTRAVQGLWWLLPIAGWIVWVYAVQRAANELWESQGATI